MQILERQEALKKQLTPALLGPVSNGCKSWNKWFGDPKNLWSPDVKAFQDDSGI